MNPSEENNQTEANVGTIVHEILHGKIDPERAKKVEKRGCLTIKEVVVSIAIGVIAGCVIAYVRDAAYNDGLVNGAVSAMCAYKGIPISEIDTSDTLEGQFRQMLAISERRRAESSAADLADEYERGELIEAGIAEVNKGLERFAASSEKLKKGLEAFERACAYRTDI